MAYTQTDIDNAKAARASGTSQVMTRDGQSLTWRTDAEFQKLIADMTVEVNGYRARRPNMMVVGFGPPKGGYR